MDHDEGNHPYTLLFLLRSSRLVKLQSSRPRSLKPPYIAKVSIESILPPYFLDLLSRRLSHVVSPQPNQNRFLPLRHRLG